MDKAGGGRAEQHALDRALAAGAADQHVVLRPSRVAQRAPRADTTSTAGKPRAAVRRPARADAFGRAVARERSSACARIRSMPSRITASGQRDACHRAGLDASAAAAGRWRRSSRPRKQGGCGRDRGARGVRAVVADQHAGHRRCSSAGRSSSARSLATQASAPKPRARAANAGSSSTPITITRTAPAAGRGRKRVALASRRRRSSRMSTSGRARRSAAPSSRRPPPSPTSLTPSSSFSSAASARRALPHDRPVMTSTRESVAAWLGHCIHEFCADALRINYGAARSTRCTRS